MSPKDSREPRRRILVVDDEPRMIRFIQMNLELEGYEVIQANNGFEALNKVRDALPDLIILDVMMPNLDGFETLRLLREVSQVPVIMLTVKADEEDKVRGLELGADDYVTKPFDFDVLAARVKAVLRRTQKSSAIPIEPTPLTVGDLSIDPLAHVVTLNGRPLDLPPREFDLLYVLVLEAGHVISTNDLIARVWGAEFDGEPQVVYVHIRWLREKLEDDPNQPHRIVTVRGVGYKLEPQAA